MDYTTETPYAAMQQAEIDDMTLAMQRLRARFNGGDMAGTKPNSGTKKDGRLKGNPGSKPGPKKGSHNKK